MTARRGKVDLDATRSQLEQAGLVHAAGHLAELVEGAAKQELSSHGFLDRLLGVELAEREERRIKTSFRLSGLPPGQTLGNFDFSFQPTMEKSRVETLATCAWIREHATTLIAGRPAPERRISPCPWASRRSRTASRWPSTGSTICSTR